VQAVTGPFPVSETGSAGVAAAWQSEVRIRLDPATRPARSASPTLGAETSGGRIWPCAVRLRDPWRLAARCTTGGGPEGHGAPGRFFGASPYGGGPPEPVPGTSLHRAWVGSMTSAPTGGGPGARWRTPTTAAATIQRGSRQPRW